ncbi:MAG TPA: outer membrane beta-barrel protein [Terriglobia bacterium]|nr:outer membrane beta-barrel protein [Terriglobia bacterium]
MKHRLTTLILASVSLLTFSNAAFAQLKENFALNFFWAGSAYSSKEYQISFPQSITPVDGKFRLDTAWRGGVRANVFDRGHWGQEFFYSFEPNTAHFIRRTTPQSSLDLRIQVHNLGANALYYFGEDETRPVRAFATIGLGMTIYKLTTEAEQFVRDPRRGNVPDMDSSRELAMNYGVGLKARMGSYIGFRTDLRGFVGRNPSFGLARQSTNPNATVFPAAGAINNGEVSAGLIFYFRKR